MDNQQKKQYQQVNEFDKLVHRVFKQSEDGAKLLGFWNDHLMTSPEDSAGIDPFRLGQESGRKDFVRRINGQIIQAEGKT